MPFVSDGRFAKCKLYFTHWSNSRLVRIPGELPAKLDARCGTSKRWISIRVQAQIFKDRNHYLPDGYEVVLYGEIVETGRIILDERGRLDTETRGAVATFNN